MRALETESKARAENLGEDAAFLRELVLDGRWEDAVTLIKVIFFGESFRGFRRRLSSI